jgi:dipeptidyl aminopeptidase/acylaminoacyl peptidase
MRILASILIFISTICTQTTRSLAEEASSTYPDDGKIVEQKQYQISSPSQKEWLGELTKRGVPHPITDQLATLYPINAFDRYKSGEKAEGFRITYMSEGLKITGIMIRPKGFDGPRPVIIYNHGGVMKWGRIVLSEILEFYHLAEQGYIVLASNFRGTHGSEGKEEMGGGDITDILNMIKVADRLEHADKHNIFFWGFSRGGAATYKALTYTDRISAAIIHAGPVNFLQEYRRAEFDEHIFPYVVPGYNTNKDTALRAISALHWVDQMAPVPLLLLHGENDKRVLAEDSIKMANKLKELGRNYRLIIYEDGDHNLLAHYKEVRQSIDLWLKEHTNFKAEN